MTSTPLLSVALILPLLLSCAAPPAGSEAPRPRVSSQPQAAHATPQRAELRWEKVALQEPTAPNNTRPPEPSKLETEPKRIGPPAGPTGPTAPKAQAGTQHANGHLALTTRLGNTHVLASSDGTVYMDVILQATRDAGDARLPLNIALVIDRSGSMRGDKLRDTKAAARHLIGAMRAEDTLAIVSYSDDVRVDMSATRMDEETRDEARRTIARIRAGGSTNLSGGLFRGQDEVRRHLKIGQVNRVLLLSDGLANRGVTDPKRLAERAQQTAQEGISVTTMGVGVDYNEDLMTSLADHASGNYYFIKDSNQIAVVFSAELKKMRATVAQNTELTIQLGDGVQVRRVYGYTYDKRHGQVRIPLAEVYGGQRRSVLLAFTVPTDRPLTQRLAAVTLTYRDTSSEGERKTTALSSQITVTRDAGLVEKNRDKAVAERVGEQQVAAAVEEAANLLRDGRSGEAKKVLQEVRAQNRARMHRLGGSARLQKQEGALGKIQMDFEAAADSPAAAPAAVKASKAQSHTLSR